MNILLANLILQKNKNKISKSRILPCSSRSSCFKGFKLSKLTNLILEALTILWRCIKINTEPSGLLLNLGIDKSAHCVLFQLLYDLFNFNY